MDLHPLVVVMMVTGTRDHRRTARVRRIHKYIGMAPCVFLIKIKQTKIQNM